MKLVKGTLVEYVDGFGAGMTRQARIVSIELCDKGEKYGKPVEWASFDDVQNSDNYTIVLDNKKWAYGSQVKAVLS
jgi:hypothetical protein